MLHNFGVPPAGPSYGQIFNFGISPTDPLPDRSSVRQTLSVQIMNFGDQYAGSSSDKGRAQARQGRLPSDLKI